MVQKPTFEIKVLLLNLAVFKLGRKTLTCLFIYRPILKVDGHYLREGVMSCVKPVPSFFLCDICESFILQTN